MARWAPEKRDVMAQLVDELLHNYGRGRALVAVDGDPGLTGALAADIAEELGRRGHAAFRASAADFARPRGERSGAPTAYADGIDHSVLRRILIEPFRMGGGAAFVTAAYDVAREAPVPAKWRSGPDDAILLVDGLYLLRPELRGLWNASIRVDGPPGLGSSSPQITEEDHRRYSAETDVRRVATILMDASDPEHPRRVFADSC